MKGDKGKLPFAIRIPADTEWTREFSGTLLGFDDYVSESFLSTARWLCDLIVFLDMVLEDVTEL
jgi:hypothetical protein